VKSGDLEPGMRVLLDTRGIREPVTYLRWDVVQGMAVVRLESGEQVPVWLGRLHPLEED